MKTPHASPRRPSAEIYFRDEILNAEGQGVDREDMTLHLTLSDVSQLRRARDLPVSDISFAGGTMRYLGVKIVEGGVAVSELHYPGRE